MKKYTILFSIILLFAGCTMVRDVDGNHYKTVKINGMQWMAENLRTTHYADGTPIAQAHPGSKGTEQPLYYDRFEQLDSTKKYGLLYNWYAAVRLDTSDSFGVVKGVCPDGWHLPSTAEWDLLSKGCFAERSRMASEMTSHYRRLIKKFMPQNHAGFSIPYEFAQRGEVSYWWSSSLLVDTVAIGRYIESFNEPCPYVCYGQLINGYSVRCVRDGAIAKSRTFVARVSRKK